MLRILMVAAVAWPLAVSAAERPASQICTDAGFRPNTLNYQLCVARIEGDDPLAGLESGLDDERVPADQRPVDALVIPEPGRPAVAPVKPPVRDGEFPAVTGTAASAPPPPPAEPPPRFNNDSGGITAPTPPTPPDINSFTVTVPAWTWDGR